MPNQEGPPPQESKQPEPVKRSSTSDPTSSTSPLPPPPSTSTSSSSSTASVSSNWLIHSLYVQQDFPSCLRVIDGVLVDTGGQCEFAIYTKALIRRQQGLISDSLSLFQQATLLNPHNTQNLKQVGRSLYLLGKHRQAIEVYCEAQRIGIDDWEVWHNKGLCHLHMKAYTDALDCFTHSNQLNRHDSTYLQIGRVHTLQEHYEQAIEVYTEALDHSPDNPDILTTVGLLFLRLGQNYRAFDYLGSALVQDPRNPKSILAAGSIIQDHNDMDVALVKYRIAACQTPNSAQLWNNIGHTHTHTHSKHTAHPLDLSLPLPSLLIPALPRVPLAGMCFFGKQRYVAAIACLKRALYLDPFEWIISYNLGLVHLNTSQYASAFHYLSSSINLKPDFPSSYMYLAICLSRLDDIDNAVAAYEKAVAMESDHLFHLNFAITAWQGGKKEKAAEQWAAFMRLWNDMGEEMRGADNDVVDMMLELERSMALDTTRVAAAAAAQHTAAQPHEAKRKGDKKPAA